MRPSARSIARCPSAVAEGAPPSDARADARVGALALTLVFGFGLGCDNGRGLVTPGTGGAGVGAGGAAGVGMGGESGAGATGTGGALGGAGNGGDAGPGGAGIAGASVGGTSGRGGAVGSGGAIATGGAVGTGGATGTGGTIGGCPNVAGAALGTASHPIEGANHVVACAAVCYGTMPPSSGNHYPSWPVYKTYSTPVPWGYMVHGLEHGAVEVVYNCPNGCADEVAAAQAWIDSLPTDTPCGMPPRVVLAPDPTLDVRWAATSWGWTLRTLGFDRAAFQQFFTAHYDHGPESICGGAVDQSATGWCG